MTYIPHTDEERRSMLETIGVDSVDQLFADVPEALRFPKLHLPDALCEMEAAHELDEKELNSHDPDYQVLITVRAEKPQDARD